MRPRCRPRSSGRATLTVRCASSIHCAGIGTAGRIVGRDGPLPQQTFEHTVSVNLFGTFNVLRLAAHAMSLTEPVGEERGVFVATASIAAYEGQLGQAAYAAAKGGIVALVLPAARELARFGIRVMAIAPGFFETPLLTELPPEAVQKLVADDSVPGAARQTGRVRAARAGDRREPLAQRRDDPPRRRPAPTVVPVTGPRSL